jgi:hypothetical protein
VIKNKKRLLGVTRDIYMMVSNNDASAGKELERNLKGT